MLCGTASARWCARPIAVIGGVDRVRVDAIQRLPVLAVEQRDPRQRIASLDVPTAQQATFEADTVRVRGEVAFQLLGDELRVDAAVGSRAVPELLLEPSTQLDHRVRDLLQGPQVEGRSAGITAMT